LEDITVFGEDEDLKLADIFANMANAASIPDPKADGTALRNFFREVAPKHDEDRVYASDMKKIITWFNAIKDLPLFTEGASTEEAETPVAEEPAEEAIEAKPAKKTKSKSAKTK
jgi:hypothetical protein